MHAALPESAYPISDGDRRRLGCADRRTRRSTWPATPPVATSILRKLDPELAEEARSRDKIADAGQQQLRGRGRARGRRRARRERHAPRPARAGTLVSRAPRSIRIRAAPGEGSMSIGASLPGAPVIVAGSNRDVAWGFTNSYADTSDWVRVLRDADDRSTTGPRTANRRHRAARRRSSACTARADETLASRRHRMGPGHRQGRRRHAARARLDRAAARRVRHPSCSGSSSPRRPTKPSPLRSSAACRRRTSSSAIAQGNIEWTIAGRLPKRVGDYDPQLPSDWSAARHRLGRLARRARLPADRQSAVAAPLDRQSARHRRSLARACSATAATTSARARARFATICAHTSDFTPATTCWRSSSTIARCFSSAGRICWRCELNRAPTVGRCTKDESARPTGTDARRSIRSRIGSCARGATK